MKPVQNLSNVARIMLVAVAAAIALGANWLILAFQNGGQQPVVAESKGDRPTFPVKIRQPAGPPRVKVSIGEGPTFDVSCTTCHASRPPNRKNRSTGDLDEFHQGLTVAHGKLGCLQCHNASNYDQLALADGSPVAFENVMDLCAQCHGPQTRDYEHGAHGGMTGYWDLTRGPRQRNNCVDCHDPHSPAFPKMQPTFKPKDRFLPNSH